MGRVFLNSKRMAMKRSLFVALMLTGIAAQAQQPAKLPPRPKATLGGTITGNYMADDGKVIRPQVSAAEILANPMIVVDSPGWKVLEYKVGMLSSDKQYWGPFVIAGPKMDERVIAHVKSADFKKGRMFIENILLEKAGRKLVANNIIIDYSN